MRKPDNSLPFVDLELSRRLELAEGRGSAAFVSAHADHDAAIRAEWTEVAGTLAMFDGPESPMTQTFGLGLGAPVGTEEMEQLEAFFSERGAPVFHEVSPLTGETMLSLLAERGYRAIELTSVLYRSLSDSGAGTGTAEIESGERAAVTVRTIEGGEEDLWAEIAAEGWRDEAPELVDFLLHIGRTNARRHDARCFLAEIDGQASATGLLSLDQGVALLAGASTLPRFRRLGAQAALLDARLRFARQNGCDLAMMCARPGSASQRNAERQGFRIAYTRIKWHKVL